MQTGTCVFYTCIFHPCQSYLGFPYLCIPSPGTYVFHTCIFSRPSALSTVSHYMSPLSVTECQHCQSLSVITVSHQVLPMWVWYTTVNLLHLLWYCMSSLQTCKLLRSESVTSLHVISLLMDGWWVGGLVDGCMDESLCVCCRWYRTRRWTVLNWVTTTISLCTVVTCRPKPPYSAHSVFSSLLSTSSASSSLGYLCSRSVCWFKFQQETWQFSFFRIFIVLLNDNHRTVQGLLFLHWFIWGKLTSVSSISSLSSCLSFLSDVGL